MSLMVLQWTKLDSTNLSFLFRFTFPLTNFLIMIRPLLKIMSPWAWFKGAQHFYLNNFNCLYSLMCCSHNSNEISAQPQRGRLRWTVTANTTSKIKNKITDSDTHFTMISLICEVPSGHQGTEETLENMAWKVTPRLPIHLDKSPRKQKFYHSWKHTPQWKRVLVHHSNKS